MAITPKQLYQGKPTNTAASVLATTSGKKVVVTEMWLAENAAAANTVYIYHDADGTTYDTTTLVATIPLVANETQLWQDMKITLDNTSGNLAIKLGTTQQVTVTLYGYEIT